MKAELFIEKALSITKLKTVYMWGTFGSTVSDALIKQKAKQYPRNYSASKQQALAKLIGTHYAFDCVGLIKGILWGWNGDRTKTYGGAKYTSNNVPDIDANVMIKSCKNVSLDFKNILPGEVVWLQGHIGIYIGGGKVVEATPSFSDGVQITALGNLGDIKGLPSRKWTSHGQLPWVEYSAKEEEWIGILKSKVNQPDDWIKFVEKNKNDPMGKWLPQLIIALDK
jgi:cell wall-associated NlpC family hydrolase